MDLDGPVEYTVAYYSGEPVTIEAGQQISITLRLADQLTPAMAKAAAALRAMGSLCDGIPAVLPIEPTLPRRGIALGGL